MCMSEMCVFRCTFTHTLPSPPSHSDWFLLCLAVLFSTTLYLALAPPDWWPWLWDKFQLTPPPSFLFRVVIVELALLNWTLAYFLEVRGEVEINY